MPKAVLSAFFAVVVVVSCTKKSDDASSPKAALTEYIRRSFNVTQASDREKLLELLAGDAHNRLAMWSVDQFVESWVNAKRKFIKLKIHDQKKISEDRVLIVYELEYEDLSKGRHLRMTQFKNAVLSRADGVWKISEVRSVKELIEYRDELSLP